MDIMQIITASLEHQTLPYKLLIVQTLWWLSADNSDAAFVQQDCHDALDVLLALVDAVANKFILWAVPVTWEGNLKEEGGVSWKSSSDKKKHLWYMDVNLWSKEQRMNPPSNSIHYCFPSRLEKLFKLDLQSI